MAIMSLEPGDGFWTLCDIRTGARQTTNLSLALSIGTALTQLAQREPGTLVIVRYRAEAERSA